MKMLLNDFRYAFRQLRRAPGRNGAHSAAVTLALGLGATAAVYSVIHSVLLSPLPYADPDRLVGVSFNWPLMEPNAEQAGSTADFIREHSTSFSSVAILDDSGPAVNLSIEGGHAVQVSALGVSEGYFRTLGIMPALGRAFTSDEDRPGAAHVAILSDGLWKRAFGRDASIVGRAIRRQRRDLHRCRHHAREFSCDRGNRSRRNWAHLIRGSRCSLSPKSPGYEGDNWEMIARLRPGVSLAQARQELGSLQNALYAQYPDYRKDYSLQNRLYEFHAWPLQEVVVSGVRRSLLTVMGAVLAVLLVACLNLAGLMMARAMRRSREIGLRSALGATRAQLVRLLAAEGLLLAFAGGLLAIAAARAFTFVLSSCTRAA